MGIANLINSFYLFGTTSARAKRSLDPIVTGLNVMGRFKSWDDLFPGTICFGIISVARIVGGRNEEVQSEVIRL